MVLFYEKLKVKFSYISLIHSESVYIWRRTRCAGMSVDTKVPFPIDNNLRPNLGFASCILRNNLSDLLVASSQEILNPKKSKVCITVLLSN